MREFTALSFWLKMTLIVDRRRERSVFGRTVAAAAVAAATQLLRAGARFVAVATIVLWVAIIFLGRAIAYDVEVWGSWHLA